MSERNNQIWAIDLDTLWFTKSTTKDSPWQYPICNGFFFWGEGLILCSNIRKILVWLNSLNIPSFNLCLLSLVTAASTLNFRGLAFQGYEPNKSQQWNSRSKLVGGLDFSHILGISWNSIIPTDELIYSPPARWGLLDFMSVASSSSSCLVLLSSSSSSPPRPPRPPRPPCHPCRPCRPRRPCSTAIRDPQCSLPDLNHDHPRPVFPAGPQPRVSTPSVPCRTSCRKIWDKECAEES